MSLSAGFVTRAIAVNGWQLPEGGDIEALNRQLALNFDRCTKLASPSAILFNSIWSRNFLNFALMIGSTFMGQISIINITHNVAVVPHDVILFLDTNSLSLFLVW